MSGTPRVKPPRNNAEWARNTEKRQSAVEHPTSQRVGRWVLSEHPETGALIASHVNGGSTVLALPPAPSDDAGADDVVQNEAVLSLTKLALQAINNGPTVVTWDGVLTDVGNWTSGVVTGGVTTVAVPISGDYLLTTTLLFPSAGNTAQVGIQVNGITSIVGIKADSSGSSMSVEAVGVMPLLAGDTLAVVAASSPARNTGGFPVTGTTVPSMFTATLLSTGG